MASILVSTAAQIAAQLPHRATPPPPETKMMRRFVNLVTRNDAERVYSVRRMDPYKQLFYQSAKAAIEAAAAADEAAMKESCPAWQTLQLPHPCMNFTAKDRGARGLECSLDMFALFIPRGTSEGRIVYSSTNGEAGHYDADKHVHNTLGFLNQPKGLSPLCLSIAHPGSNEDSMYVLGSFYPEPVDGPGCFEVLEFGPSCRGMSSLALKTWRWRLLPPPPFLREPGCKRSSITAYTAVADGNGCSTIYVSCSRGIGTYSFEATRHDPSCREGWSPSEEWSRVGGLRLPFDGRAQYVPEFNLWFGFSDLWPNHLCVADLSAMDRERRPPTVLQDWQDLNPPDGHVWIPWDSYLVNLGDGKFLIAKKFESGANGSHFAVLTGIEMMMGDDRSLKMVKHKCARFVFGEDSIECVL